MKTQCDDAHLRAQNAEAVQCIDFKLQIHIYASTEMSSHVLVGGYAQHFVYNAVHAVGGLAKPALSLATKSGCLYC